MIKAILFDFYGVFAVDSYTAWLDAHNLTRSGKYLDLVRLLDDGKIDTKIFFEQLSEISGDDVASITKAFQTSSTLDIGVINILTQLHNLFTIALTSNGTSHTRDRLQTASIEIFFHEVFISSEIGASKPDQLFFSHVLNNLNLKPEECLLIDDSQLNIAAAAAMNFKTISYKNSSELRNQLKDFGIQLEP